VRGLFRHFLNLNAAFGRGHKDHATGRTVNHRAQIEFLIDVGRRFNQDLVYRLAVGVSLIGHQAFAQPVFSESANLFLAVNHFHAARFTASAGMNLTFHYPRASTNFRGRFFCFAWRSAGVTGGCRHTIPCKQLFRLVFV